MILLQVSDFKNNDYQIATSIYSEPLLQSTIDKWEKHFIVQLLGVELGEEFITQIGGTPDAEYVTLRDPFYEQDDDECIYHSMGVKEFLKAMIYYKYIFPTDSFDSQSGVAHAQAETSTVVAPINTARTAERRYNEALPTIRAIQWLCKTHAPDDYPTYKGKKFEAVSAVFL